MNNNNLNQEQLNSILQGEDLTVDDVRYVRAIVKEPYKEPEVVALSIKLEDLQALVKGLIEIVAAPFYDNIDIIINEEGKYQEDCEPNIYLPEYDDILCGTLIVTGFDINASDHTSLTDKQIEYTLNYIKANYIAEEEGKEINKQDFIYFRVF